jgi:hypothetical protein
MTWMDKLRLILAMEPGTDREDALAVYLAELLATGEGMAALAKAFLADEETALWTLVCVAQTVDEQVMIATLN